MIKLSNLCRTLHDSQKLSTSAGRWYHVLLVASTLSSHCDGAFYPCLRKESFNRQLKVIERCSMTAHTGKDSFRLQKRCLSSKEDSNESTDRSKDSLKSGLGHSPRELILAKNPQPEDHPILEATMDWIQNVVIGMNFCPFAEKPWKAHSLKQQSLMTLEVVHGQNEEEILSRVLGECLVKQKHPGTSLLICPDLYPHNFANFLQVYTILNDGVLIDCDLTEDIQVAPFHPYFEFDGSGGDGIDNYTNRSPYPIFHILREEEVSHAVDLLDGDASRVWKRNVNVLEAMGEEFDDEQIRQIMSGTPEIDPEIQRRVKEILKTSKVKRLE